MRPWRVPDGFRHLHFGLAVAEHGVANRHFVFLLTVAGASARAALTGLLQVLLPAELLLLGAATVWYFGVRPG